MENEHTIDGDLLAALTENGYGMIMRIPGRGVCGIARMTFTVGVFYGLGPHSYQGRYCFETKFEAIESLFNWDGNSDPPGDWIKHKGAGGEYSNPNYRKE